MANKAVLECVDAILRKIMGNDLPFGGKVILLSGDFRQTYDTDDAGTVAASLAK